MSRVDKLKYLVEHCTAGFGDIKSIQSFWKNELKWSGKGYNVITDLDGVNHYLINPKAEQSYSTVYDPICWTFITNGVKGYNEQSINFSYIGGVEKVNGKYKGKDTRTELQKAGMFDAEIKAIQWLKDQGKTFENMMILGHRDFSKDLNKNNTIESFERIKECPCYDTITEKRWVFQSENNSANIIPNK